MTTHSGIKTNIQQLAPDSALVELYSIDLSPLGTNTTYYFTDGNLNGDLVYFNTIAYTPIPVESEGFEFDGQGKLPRPKLRISNINSSLVASIIGYDDLVGARVIRRRTFVKYLDDQPSADPTAQFPRDIYYIERKTRQTKFDIEFELISAIDLENVYLPRKQVLESCTHRYRFYDGSAFDYTDITCPYNGASYFTDNGAVTADPAEDNCGRRLKDCKLRFGLLAPLPYEGFPNVAKFDVNYR
jgi:lambda family phage minor tail protein L